MLLKTGQNPIEKCTAKRTNTKKTTYTCTTTKRKYANYSTAPFRLDNMYVFSLHQEIFSSFDFLFAIFLQRSIFSRQNVASKIAAKPIKLKGKTKSIRNISSFHAKNRKQPKISIGVSALTKVLVKCCRKDVLDSMF